VRIIRGSLKGKRFATPPGFPSRPTTDYAKEGLFNMLDNMLDLNELRVLDLCAGTGNISFEFVSRGAAHLLAIDSHPRCVQYLKQNIQTLQISAAMQVYKSDCVIYCRNAKNVQYDLIFADPPYHLGFHNELIETIFDKDLLHPEGLVVIEHGKQHDFSAIPQFDACRNFGNVYFSFFKHKP
jgi:16S rRNA (guanine(966)-N(2))-methyltransferase RsmD